MQSKGLVIILIVLVAANAALFVGTVVWKTYDERDLRAYPMIDISRHFVAQKNFIVTLAPVGKEINKLISDDEQLTGATNTVSVYLEFLNSGANVQINTDSRIYPASLVKIPVALAVMKKIDLKEWKLSDQFTLEDADKNSEFGTMYQNLSGSKFTVDDLLKTMLVDSDNTAFHMLLKNLSESELQDIKDELGMENLYDAHYQINAKEYSRFFRSLYYSSYLERESSQKILQWLGQSEFSQFLASGLPHDVPFAHKVGIAVGQNVYEDSGVVYAPNRPYLLTVMIKGHDEARAQEIMKQISKDAYDYISTYKH